MKFYETKEFRRQNRQWGRKLRASGFRDIERDEHRLYEYSYQVLEKYDPTVVDYYSKAHDFLNSYQFETETDRFIWERHTSGRSCREISAELEKSTLYTPLSKSSVHDRITKFEGLMLKRAV